MRVSVIDFKGNWDDHFPLRELAYKNSYSQILLWLRLKHILGEGVDLWLGGFK